MSLSMYRSSVPVFLRALANLSNILNKGAEDAAARNIDPAVYLNDRLAPNMFNLIRQVQIACDGPIRASCRLAGMEIPSNPDTETTFDDLQARIDKTVAFLKTLPEAAFEGSETRDITIPLPSGALDFKGEDFLFGFALPNVYFHITSAYLILRHNGVALGKQDFLGAR